MSFEMAGSSSKKRKWTEMMLKQIASPDTTPKQAQTLARSLLRSKTKKRSSAAMQRDSGHWETEDAGERCRRWMNCEREF